MPKKTMPRPQPAQPSKRHRNKGRDPKLGTSQPARLPTCLAAHNPPSVGPMTTHGATPQGCSRQGRAPIPFWNFSRGETTGAVARGDGPCAPLSVSPPTARRRQARESGSQLFVLQAQTSGIQTEAAESRVGLLAHTPRLTATDFRRRRDMINGGGWSPNPHARCFFRASAEASSEIDQHTTHSSHAVWQAGESLADKQGIPSRPCIPLPINYHAELLSSRIWCNMRKFDQASPFPNQRRNHVAKQVTENPPPGPNPLPVQPPRREPQTPYCATSTGALACVPAGCSCSVRWKLRIIESASSMAIGRTSASALILAVLEEDGQFCASFCWHADVHTPP